MISITPFLQRLPASDVPLSGDVFRIIGNQYSYYFDVGKSRQALDFICESQQKRVVILSHMHPDHTFNLKRMDCEQVFVSPETYRRIGRGTLVEQPLVIRDGVEICIRPCVSPHMDGCLIATVNGAYTFLGDLPYRKEIYDPQKLEQMLRQLEAVQTRYFVLSHSDPGIYDKETFLRCARENSFRKEEAILFQKFT